MALAFSDLTMAMTAKHFTPVINNTLQQAGMIVKVTCLQPNIKFEGETELSMKPII
jgi:hypothetical protein